MSIQRVLCPVDFSDHSRRALHHAQAMAAWYEAELHVLHVRPDLVRMPLVVPSIPLTVPIAPADVAPATSTAVLQKFIDEAGWPRPALPVVRDGKPAAGIVEYASEIDADLIVIGTHGHAGFERVLLGSTAEHVMNEAACPVLNIPPHGDEPGSAERVRFTRVLCAVDFSPSSLQALERGVLLAQEYAAHLTLLHVLEIPSKLELVAGMGVTPHEYVMAKVHEAHERLSAAVPDEARTWCRVSEIVRPGRPAPVILQEADFGNADLIVMGSQGHQGLSLAFLGSTTHTVVRAAVCPVLTARGTARPGARGSVVAQSDVRPRSAIHE
jgi:nucleotide-binding universal stress UspA family protein